MEVDGLRMQGSGLSGRSPSLLTQGAGGPGLAGPCDVASYLSTLNIPSVHIFHCYTGTPLIICVALDQSTLTAAVTAVMPYGKSNPKRGQESLGKALQRRRALERAAADRYYFPPPTA